MHSGFEDVVNVVMLLIQGGPKIKTLYRINNKWY